MPRLPDLSTIFSITGRPNSSAAVRASSIVRTTRKGAVVTPPRAKASFIRALSVSRRAASSPMPGRPSTRQT